PNIVYYDKACRIYLSLRKHLRHKGLYYERLRKLYDNVCFIVDKFHIKSHVDGFCEERCNPNFVDSWVASESGEGKFNTQVAEQGNVWFGQISHILRNVNAVTHDFFMYTLVDKRN
ncbi:hypothetical protein BDR26DRAFT_793950, partial [Obelidium mucronatum]